MNILFGFLDVTQMNSTLREIPVLIFNIEEILDNLIN